jgi:hypothetical protein
MYKPKLKLLDRTMDRSGLIKNVYWVGPGWYVLPHKLILILSQDFKCTLFFFACFQCLGYGRASHKSRMQEQNPMNATTKFPEIHYSICLSIGNLNAPTAIKLALD